MADREVWKPIKGYEGLYAVSSAGNVKSLPHEVPCVSGKRTISERVISKYKNKSGYISVCLAKEGKKKSHLLHRLVATAFIENPNGLLQVNHKNENKADNRIENLEWVSASYNSNYGTRNERISTKISAIQCKPVAQILNGVIIKTFPSTIAAREVADPGHIGHCCNGKRKTAGGYQWAFI